MREQQVCVKSRDHVQFARQARIDVLGITDYLFERSGQQKLIRRFLASLDETTAMLARHPHLGRTFRVDDQDLRHFVVRRFRKYHVFYRVMPSGIRIIRVLHGARDVPSILSSE